MGASSQIPVTFREVQRFRQPWLWALVLTTPAILLYAIVQQLVFGRPFGNNPSSDELLIAMGILLGAGLPLLFLSARLVTEVRAEGLHLRFHPFHRAGRRIAPEEIVSCEARSYSAIREYGGWGIRSGLHGKAYNVHGDQGVQLILRDGTRLLVGSQRAEELAAQINALRR
ncbi:MAG: hypothetical protein KAY32_01765 [Candidatus Eisenbacteria sp.]|nr:hypothetical protein [Candidatus Eisenbacteria bacterium]